MGLGFTPGVTGGRYAPKAPVPACGPAVNVRYVPIPDLKGFQKALMSIKNDGPQLAVGRIRQA